MNLYWPVLKQVSLFYGIDEIDLKKLLQCLQASERRYGKDEVVFLAGQPVTGVGIVLEGKVQVIQEDALGGAAILAEMLPGEMFAEAFACSSLHPADKKALPVTVISVTESVIFLLDYRRIITSCPLSCPFHTKLIENMLAVLADKTILLNRKLGYLSKRTTREKLLAYLGDQSAAQKSKSFHIPFNRQELADYLCVERSAMSAALCALRDDGILRFRKNRFELL